MKYLRPKRSGSSTVAICDRCRMKFYLSELRPDWNNPGLRVCVDCRDEKDPYKLPARPTEDVSVRHPRPDEPLTVPEE